MADLVDKRFRKEVTAMRAKNDAKELFDEISDVLGDDTPSPSPRFSPKKSPSVNPLNVHLRRVPRNRSKPI